MHCLNWLVLPILMAFAGTQPKDCEPGIICVEAVSHGDSAELLATSLAAQPLTVTVDMRLVNMRSTRPLPLTVTLSAGERLKLFSVNRVDKRQQWSYHFHYDWNWGSLDPRVDINFLYRLPYDLGRSFVVMQGNQGSFTHVGSLAYAFDFDMPEGTSVFAAREGVVVYVKVSSKQGGSNPSFRNQANMIKVEHADATIAVYEHLQPGGAVVKTGQAVQAGQLLGYSGATGYLRLPHLHFEVHKRIDGKEAVQSLPIRFRSREATPVIPLQNQRYTAVE